MADFTIPELCAWLRDHSAGAYRPSAEAADLILKQEKRIKELEAAARSAVPAQASAAEVRLPVKLAADVLGALFYRDSINPGGYEAVKQEFATLMRGESAAHPTQGGAATYPVPQGWQLVPIKATHQMAWAIMLAHRWEGDSIHKAETAWSDALGKAPAAPAPLQGEHSAGAGLATNSDAWRAIDAAMPKLAQWHCPALHALSKADKEIFAREIIAAHIAAASPGDGEHSGRVADADRYEVMKRLATSGSIGLLGSDGEVYILSAHDTGGWDEQIAAANTPATEGGN